MKQFKQAQILLLHNDEKWFYAIVVRTHNKYVPYLAVVPAANKTHHRSHVDKVMCLCTTGFLPKNNDIEEGGTAIKIDFDRAGRMQRASRDTYRRVYDDEGRYTMPKRPENRLRGRVVNIFVQWKSLEVLKELQPNRSIL